MLPDEQLAALERRRADLRSQFASIGEMRSGTLTKRFRRCGKSGCHCAKPGDRGHGPVLSLTRKQAGKTVTRIIPSHAAAATQARVAEYRRFGNCRRPSWRSTMRYPHFRAFGLCVSSGVVGA